MGVLETTWAASRTHVGQERQLQRPIYAILPANSHLFTGVPVSLQFAAGAGRYKYQGANVREFAAIKGFRGFRADPV